MFAALTGILASRNTEPEFFTSALYPLAVSDTLSITPGGVTAAQLWAMPVEQLNLSAPVLQAGTLVDTIIFRSYTAPIADRLAAAVPTIQTGTLVDTIIFRSYTAPIADRLSAAVPTIEAGTLVTTIAFQTYNSDVTRLGIETPTIISGTLV